MTHVYADNVRETSVSTGTGDFTLTGGVGAVSTGATGRAFSNVCSIGDTVDYVIHHRTLNEWEVGVGTYSANNTLTRTLVKTSSNANAAVTFSAGNKVVWVGPTSDTHKQFAELVNITRFGATDGGPNATPISTARTASGVNKPVLAGSGTWGLKGTLLDFSADDKGEGTGFSLVQGTDAAPSTVSNPLIYLEKRTQSDVGNHNDHGALDFRVKKTGGTNNVYSAFFAAYSAGGTGRISAQTLAVTEANTSSTGAVGQIIFIDKQSATANGITTGLEIVLMNNSGSDSGWIDSFANGSTVGINLTNDPGRGTVGIRIAPGSAGTGFYTGLLIDQQGILPDSYSTQSEAIRIKGGSDAAHQYSGIVFSGYLRTAINFNGPTYDSSAVMVIPTNRKVIFGLDTSSSTYLIWSAGSALFNVEGGSYGVGGTKVVGSRQVGWTTPTGTAVRTGFDTTTASTADVARAVKALIEDLTTHGLIG